MLFYYENWFKFKVIKESMRLIISVHCTFSSLYLSQKIFEILIKLNRNNCAYTQKCNFKSIEMRKLGFICKYFIK